MILEVLLAYKLSRGIIDSEFVVDLDSLVKDRRENVLSIGCPLTAYCTVGFGLTQILLGF